MVRPSARMFPRPALLILSLGIAFASSFALEARAQSPAGEMLLPQIPVPASAEIASLKEAKEIYVQTRKKAEQSLNLAIEGSIVDSAGAGNHAETRRLRDLQELLRRTHQAPAGTGPELQPAVDRHSTTMRVADRFLDSFYAEAIGALARANRYEEASLLAAERNTWKGLPAQSVGRPPAANPPMSPAELAARTAGSPPATVASPPGTVASPPATVGPPAADPPAASPMGPSMPPGAARQMISLQAPSIDATSPAPDLEVVSAIWTADPRFFQGKASGIIATESVRRLLKADRVIVSSAVFGDIKGLMAPKCLELTLKSEGGTPFLLRLHEGSEVVARELTPPLDKVNARPIRGSTLTLLLASWGLQDEERGASVGAEYAAQFEKGKSVSASTRIFGELTFGKPKVLRTLWRVGRTLLYVKQAENSELVVEDPPAPETPKAESPQPETPEPPKVESPKVDLPKIETPKSETPKTESPG